MQFQRSGTPAIGVIYDFDAGGGVDGALALAMLYAMEGKGEARILSTSTSRASLRSAAFCDALARFFSAAPAGGAGGFQRTAAIGMADGPKPEGDTPALQAVLDRKTADGKAVYSSGIAKPNDTADPVALIRNAMTAQNDGNCVVVMAGPATNLARVLALPDGADWIKRKVKFLVAAVSSFPEGRPDAAIAADVAAAQHVFAAWPGPIVAVGAEVGAAMPFPGESIGKDFSWAQDHPIVDAYRANRAMPYDAPAQAMAAVLYAVHPDGYFRVSEPGTITVAGDGSVRFKGAADGRHRYLMVDASQKDAISAQYVALASAKPVPRAGRGRGFQNQNQNQQAPPKAPDPIKKQ